MNSVLALPTKKTSNETLYTCLKQHDIRILNKDMKTLNNFVQLLLVLWRKKHI